MENLLQKSRRKRILICSSLDSESVAKLSEIYVPQTPQLDLIIAVGPFHCSSESCSSSKDEEEALKIADIGSILAQLENIVCRVVYLPGDKDPASIIVREAHLTPNSVTLHGRKLQLLDDLYLLGYSEPDLTSDGVPNTEVNDSFEDIRLQSARSVEVLRDLIGMENAPGMSSSATGIFVLNYHFSHTLNHFLFHLTDDLDAAKVDLCIISSGNSEETSRLPKKFGHLTIVTPGNLQHGHYTIVELEQDEVSMRWKTVSTEVHEL